MGNTNALFVNNTANMVIEAHDKHHHREFASEADGLSVIFQQFQNVDTGPLSWIGELSGKFDPTKKVDLFESQKITLQAEINLLDISQPANFLTNYSAPTDFFHGQGHIVLRKKKDQVCVSVPIYLDTLTINTATGIATAIYEGFVDSDITVDSHTDINCTSTFMLNMTQISPP